MTPFEDFMKKQREDWNVNISIIIQKLKLLKYSNSLEYNYFFNGGNNDVK